MTRSQNTTLFAFALLTPALLYILVIVAYPLLDTVHLSFTDAALKKSPNWVGWANYQKMFGGQFGDVIVRTFIWTFFSVSLKMDHRHRRRGAP